MSVSNVLRGVGRASPAARQQVWQVARELGYRPNAAARATATGRFNCISMLYSAEERRSNRSRKLIDGINDVVTERGYHLAVAVVPDEKLSSEGYVPTILRNLMCDGLLINYTDNIPEHMGDLIVRCRIPSVWINSKQAGDCVYPDDFDGAVRLTRHLLGLGHRRIAYVDTVNVLSFADRHYSSIDRQAGYEQAMKEAGLVPQVVTRLSLTTPAIPLLDAMLAKDRPTAVIAYGQTDLNHVMFAAAKAGLFVPTGLSVATFSDVPLTLMDVPITIAVVPERVVGATATRLLLDKIVAPEQVHPPRRIPFTFEDKGSVLKIETAVS